MSFSDVLSEIKQRTCNVEPLHCSWILAYKDAFENLDKKINIFVSSNRNVWDKIDIFETEDRDLLVFDFISPVRNIVRFYVSKIYKNSKYVVLRSLSFSDSKDIKSTMDSFINTSLGIWFPLLKFDYMENLPSIVKEMRGAEKPRVKRFFCQLYDRKEKKKITTLQYNAQERDGMVEYTFLKEKHRQENKILNLKTLHFILNYQERFVKFAIKNDSHIIFDTPSVEFFQDFEKIVVQRINLDFQHFYLKNLSEIKTFEEDGEVVKYIDYRGVDRHVIKIPSNLKDWFITFREFFTDRELLYEKNRLVSFVMFDDVNPSIQLQIVDVETSDIINVSAFKETNEIILSPQCQNTDVLSISKIIGAVQSCLGSRIKAG